MAGRIDDQGTKAVNYGIIVQGLPGVGKSTLLNCHLSKYQKNFHLFQSGVSMGNHTTQKPMTYTVNDEVFIKLPSLENPETRPDTARAIKKTLTSRKNIKMVFVVTLQAGRVNPDDAALIQTFLHETKINQSHCGIIFNKLSKGTRKLLEKENELTNILSLLTRNTEMTVSNTLLLPRYDELDDEDNAVLDIPELVEFINLLPAIDFDEDNEINAISLCSLFEANVCKMEGKTHNQVNVGTDVTKNIMKREHILKHNLHIITSNQLFDNRCDEKSDLKAILEKFKRFWIQYTRQILSFLTEFKHKMGKIQESGVRANKLLVSRFKPQTIAKKESWQILSLLKSMKMPNRDKIQNNQYSKSIQLDSKHNPKYHQSESCKWHNIAFFFIWIMNH